MGREGESGSADWGPHHRAGSAGRVSLGKLGKWRRERIEPPEEVGDAGLGANAEAVGVVRRLTEGT